MQLLHSLLSRHPMLGNIFSLVRLVYNLWDERGHIQFPLARRTQELAREDRISPAIFQKQAKEEPRSMSQNQNSERSKRDEE
jgi:hypothetical protein